MKLFCDCKTDEEKSSFFLSGRGVETGVIAPAISSDVAMAYHRCAEFKKELETLHAKVEAMEKQEPVGEIVAFGEFLHEPSWKRGKLPHLGTKLYALPGAQGDKK